MVCHAIVAAQPKSGVVASSRLAWIDFLRVFAILTVVLCHSVEAFYGDCIYSGNTEASELLGLSLKSQSFFFICFNVGRIGVPLFLISSGYLLLPREYDDESTWHFWRRSVIHLIVCTVIWFLLYDVFLIAMGSDIGIGTVMLDLLLVHKVSMMHVWYLPTLLGLYLTLPFAAKALQGFDLKTLCVPCVFIYLLCFVYPYISACPAVSGKAELALQLSTGFSGGVYGLYMIAGYAIRKRVLKRINSWILAIVALSSFLLVLQSHYGFYAAGLVRNTWYENPFLFLCSVTLFEFASRIRLDSNGGAVRIGARYSFGVYLVHCVLRTLYIPSIRGIDASRPLKSLILFCILALTSYMAAWLIDRIPKVGSYLLYIRS